MKRIKVIIIAFASIFIFQLVAYAARPDMSDNPDLLAVLHSDTRPGMTNIPIDQIHARTGKIDKTIRINKFKNQTEYEKALYQFRHRINVDTYYKYGFHNKAWDDKAIEFLDGFVQSKYIKNSKLSENELIPAGKRLIELGCNDPLVLSRYAILVKSNALFQQSLEEFKKSKYPKGCMRDLPFYMCNLDTTEGLSYQKRTEKWRNEAIKLTAEALDDGSYLPGEQRFVMDTILPESSILFNDFDDELPNSEWVTVFTAIKDKKNIDPYIYNVIGAHYLKFAYTRVETNGSDPMNWRIAPNLAAEMKARDMLITAWKMHPENPIAPAYLIRVTLDLLMAGKKTEDPRIWFDRARAAQYDYNPAYYLYTAYLSPDWGNDIDIYYQFGAECIRDGRFDTNVPLHMLDALKYIRNTGKRFGLADSKLSWYWENEKTGKLLNLMYDGYAKSQHQHNSAYWKSNKAAVAWYCKRYKDAKTTLKELGDKADKIVFLTDNNTPYSIVEEDSYFFTSDYVKELKLAKSIRDTDKRPEALKIYNSIYERIKNDAQLSKLLKNRIDIINIKQEFPSGKWINILPSSEFTEWSVFSGEWKINSNGYLECIPPDWWGAELFTYMNFGYRYEIKSKLDFDDKTTKFGIMINAPSIKPDWAASFTGVIMSKKSDILEITRQGLPDTYLEAYNLQLTQPSELLIQRWDDIINIYVNDKLVKKNVKLIAGPTDKPCCIGVGASSYDKGAKVQYQTLEIRILKEKPSTD